MKHIGLLTLIIGLTLSSCNQKNKTATATESKFENLETSDKSKDKEEISKLIRQLYKWEDKNQITIGQTAITDENEEIVVGLDTIKNLEFIDQFRKTNLFSEEFLNNYQKIVKTLDQKFKTKEIEWLAGDMPPFGNGANP
jgi:coproporphyrinogen III oxidase-like Fe-S oxidoreductase